MKRIHFLWVVAFLASIIVSSTTNAGVVSGQAQAAIDVPLYGVYEQAFTASSSFTYTTAPALNATFTGTSGQAAGTSMAVRGFWDGGSSFKVRFSPRLSGTWQYTTSSDDPGLNGISGAINVAGRLPEEHASFHGHVRANPEIPYTLMHQDGTPFFLMGDTQWSFSTDAIAWPDEFQTYIDTRADQGFNYVHGLVYQQWPNGNDKNEGGQIFKGNNVDDLNPGFFQALDKRIEYMNQKGIVVGFVLAWADEGWTKFTNETQVQRYAQYVMDRYGAYNLVWITAGEYEEATLPGGHNRLGNTFRDHDPYGHLRTVHTTNTSADDFGNESWHTLIYQQLHANLGKGIAQDRVHNKPVVNSEYFYENRESVAQVRQGAWEIVMSGGYFVYGNIATYHASANMNQANLDSEGARQSTYLANFFTQKTRWWELQPDHSLVNRDGVFVLSNRGEAYVVYISGSRRSNRSSVCNEQVSGPITIDLSHVSANEDFYILWYDPKTGEEQIAGGISGGGPRTLSSPFPGDAALLLSRSATGFPEDTGFLDSSFSIRAESQVYLPIVSQC